jgi:hypothetical protein
VRWHPVDLRDFNEVLQIDEHVGVSQRSHAQIQSFRDTVDVCELIDLSFEGHFWTWKKKAAWGTYTRVHLYRALGSAEWSAQFPPSCLIHFEAAEGR